MRDEAVTSPGLRAGATRGASPNDIPFLARVMYDSMLPGVGHGIFDAALEPTGTGPIAFHEALLRTGSSNWGQLDSFLIIDGPDGRPAAAMGCFLSSTPDRRPLTAEGLKNVSQHLGWSSAASRDFARRYTGFFGMFGNAPQLAQPAEYVLEYVAVRPDLRRQGLYGVLVEAHAERAHSLGCRTIGTTAVFGNDKVLGAQRKAGFREVARFGPEHYRGEFPGMIRLVRDL